MLVQRFTQASSQLERLNASLAQQVAGQTAELQQVVVQMRQARDAAQRADQAKTRFLAAASHDLRQPAHALALYMAVWRCVCRKPRRPWCTATRCCWSASCAICWPMPRATPGRAASCWPAACRLPPAACAAPGGRASAGDATGPHWRIEVWDTGLGITDAEQGRIYEEFYQVDNPGRDRAQGLGLGLAIVQRLVRLLGLSLRLRSRPGRGSCFALSLAQALP